MSAILLCNSSETSTHPLPYLHEIIWLVAGQCQCARTIYENLVLAERKCCVLTVLCIEADWKIAGSSTDLYVSACIQNQMKLMESMMATDSYS